MKPSAHPLSSSKTTPNRIYDFTELLVSQKNKYIHKNQAHLIFFLFHFNGDSGTNPTAHAGSRGKKKSSAWDNVTTVEARASSTSHWLMITNWENSANSFGRNVNKLQNGVLARLSSLNVSGRN